MEVVSEEVDTEMTGLETSGVPSMWADGHVRVEGVL